MAQQSASKRNGGPGAPTPAQQAPPSTLAATRLVDQISASSAHSALDRSDDDAATREITGLLPRINAVRADPSLLQTPADRVAHNHMLVYAMARAKLDGLARLDDPLVDPDRLRTEVQQSLNFFRIALDETPAVLLCGGGPSEWLFRGTQPLWVWLFPRVLKLLGHALTQDSTTLVEGFFHAVFYASVRVESLWELVPRMGTYLREIVNAVIVRLLALQPLPSGKPPPLKMEVPKADVLEHILGSPCTPDGPSLTFGLADVPHALRHVSGLLSVLSQPLVSPNPDYAAVAALADNFPWLLDTLSDLNDVHRRWNPAGPRIGLIRQVLDLLGGYRDGNGAHRATLHKAYTLLALLAAELAASPADGLLGKDEAAEDSRKTFCLALVELARGALRGTPVGRIVSARMLDSLGKIPELSPGFAPGTDGWRSIQLLKRVVAGPTPDVSNDDVRARNFSDPGLSWAVETLNLVVGSVPALSTAEEPSSKKRKTMPGVPVLANLTDRIRVVLDVKADEKVVSLADIFLKRYLTLGEAQKCHVLEILSRIPCAADGTATADPRDGCEAAHLACSFCDARGTAVDFRPDCLDISAKREAELIFSRIMADDSFGDSARPRVVAVIALRRLAAHSTDVDFLNLETSGPGHKCLQSLQSKLREYRIAGGRTLAVFLRDDRTSGALADVARRNRKHVFSLLKSVSDKNLPHLHESCILGWGQIGRIVNHDELNLVLIQLLEYLGNGHDFISAFAFNELINLADAKRTTPRKLLEPFWKRLAYVVTKDMVARPQMSHAIAELLQISVDKLLLLIQTHALPWLVLDRNKEVIQKIAEARQEADVWLPLMDPANLSAILSVLVVQDIRNAETFVITRFTDISPHFSSVTLTELLRVEPALTAMELLKAAGEADENRKLQIREALHMMSKLLAGPKDKPKKGHAVGRFLAPLVLNLMARLTEVFNDVSGGPPPVLELRRCICAMEEMIKLAKTHVRIARPQLSACLLSAFAHDEIREAAFSCWSALLTHLDEEDVEVLLETTFFIVNQYWASFNERTAGQVRELLRHLHSKYRGLLGAYVHRLPSVGQIPELAEIETLLRELGTPLDVRTMCGVFAARLGHEHAGVVYLALAELVEYLKRNNGELQTLVAGEKPDSVGPTLMRALLDCGSKYGGGGGGVHAAIGRLCTECIGLVGCLDCNRVEAVREHRSIIVLKNFELPSETTTFTLFLLEEVLVKSFLSATDTRLQGFLAYVMQELLDLCDIPTACRFHAEGSSEGSHVFRKWMALPEGVREILVPFLTSGYGVVPMEHRPVAYPVFQPGKLYGNWLRAFVLDLLRRWQNEYSRIIFAPLCRVIRVKDLSVAEFLLPYLVLHVIMGKKSSREEKDQVFGELLAILEYRPAAETHAEDQERRRFCEAVFRVLDYAMRWIRAKNSSKNLTQDDRQSIKGVQAVLNSIPAELISQRAVDCKEYARALFHLEQHAQAVVERDSHDTAERERLLGRIQDIYTHIDEPDGLEGISAHLRTFDLNQQVLGHRKAGRWAAARAWYEVEVTTQPGNVAAHVDLLNCLKHSGEYDALLNYVEGMRVTDEAENRIMPLAVEAAWATSRWDSLQKFSARFRGSPTEDFNIAVSVLFCHLIGGGGGGDDDNDDNDDDDDDDGLSGGAFEQTVRDMREKLAASMSLSATASLQACHDIMLKCHILTDLELIAGGTGGERDPGLMGLLERRLDVLGAFVYDKQYVLGIGRAAMELTRPRFSDLDVSSLWLTTARLARKAASLQQSFNAILHASRLGDESATIENARLLWKEGQHRKATQVLQGVIDNNAFANKVSAAGVGNHPLTGAQDKLLTAQAQLLLAKWLDHAGQTSASALREKYQNPAKTHPHWEKGHYYLGRYYKKMLESEQNLGSDEQTDSYVAGEITRLVIQNYIRSLAWGCKYLFQTLPGILTLWLEFGAQIDKAPEGKASLSRELFRRRSEQLELLHGFLDRYIERLPAYIFYTALPQMVARITHPRQQVFERLAAIIVKVVEKHPRQALWALFGIMTSRKQDERRARGMLIIDRLKAKSANIKMLLRMGEKLGGQLLMACQHGNFVSNRTTQASITKDLRFNPNCTPCPLVVPVEAFLTVTLPSSSAGTAGTPGNSSFQQQQQIQSSYGHRPFSADVVTIESFEDEVLVLGSLAKPRRLTALGSDGRKYMLLIKPKDDLRTDQRLMEFNAMINRSLKRDAETSRRQLYIRTYAVTPLNEECGIIEWVGGLRTLRDIVGSLYQEREVHVDYAQVKELLRQACAAPANGKKGGNTAIFTDTLLGKFPPVLHLWFIHQFPDPSAWFGARLRYTRSTAVMSMVGTILGLGDRHGENLCLEEESGGIFHVDFNCLFDKGLTFAQPERVPFRLTHNMVAAMGIYGYEGPFRRSCELTLGILRQNEETLMTVLEAFIYDPTLELQTSKRGGGGGTRAQAAAQAGAGAAKEGGMEGGWGGGRTAAARNAVEGIRRKVRGLLPDESIPLGVEGHVDELIKQAVDPRNLAAMYVGWMSFW